MPVSKSERLFLAANAVGLILLCVACVAPLIHIVAVSLSGRNPVALGRVGLWPQDYNTGAYRHLLRRMNIWGPMWIAGKRVVLTLLMTLVLTVLAAYPLSQSTDRFLGRRLFAWFFLISMILNGGIIPNYLVIRSLNLIGSIWALVLPNTVVAFYILIALNYFRGLPREIQEAARIDGASEWGILFRIVLPVSSPALATIAVFCALAQWNEWFTGIIYMNEPAQYPLMSYLQAFPLESESGRAAQLVVGAVPILCVYPLVQGYFRKGLVLGVK